MADIKRKISASFDDGETFGDAVARKCVELYNTLGKTGKPQGDQWTHLGGIVEELEGELQVVSLATGTKCLGQKSMSSEGHLVNDSHAEVLARRAFMRYLYDQVEETIVNGQSRIFSHWSKELCHLKAGVKFHFFMSHVPCGDASIIPMDTIDRKRMKLSLEQEEVISQDVGPCVDIHRTGAKCLPNSEKVDTKESGRDYHVTGVVRTKPGRGDPTLSVSCSDKIARWCFTGLQGALLSLLIDRIIEIESLTIGGGGQYCEEALRRAISTRFINYMQKMPKVYRSSIVFPHSKSLVIPGAKPAPTSLIWCNLRKEKCLEVAVEGKRLGATKKAKDKGRLKICKRELFANFASLTKKAQFKTYGEVKDMAADYKKNTLIFKKLAGAWTTKPLQHDFKLAV